MTAVDDWIADLQNGRYSTVPQNLISDVDIAVLALMQIQAGLVAPVPQLANTIFAGPAGGVPALAAFRALVAADIPAVLGATTFAGTLAMAAGQLLNPDPIGGLVGTNTNNNPTIGAWGEFNEAVVTDGAPVALVSGVDKDVAAVALAAGDYDISASCVTSPAGTTTTSAIAIGLNTVANTLPAAELRFQSAAAITAGNRTSAVCARRRFSLAAPATVRMVANVQFAVSTLGACGFINWRRMR